MRVIVRKERPSPGARLRFTEVDGHRFTVFTVDARRGQLAHLELRHRRRARCEDRIHCAKETGLRNLPLKGFAANQLWREIVALACELLAWTQLLALAREARRWEPKRLRLRVFSVAGRLARSGRRLRLPFAERWPWTPDITAAGTRLQPLPSGRPAGTSPTTRKENLGPVPPRPPGATAGQSATGGGRKSTPA
jgi:hypothetical protein